MEKLTKARLLDHEFRKS